MKCHVHRAMSGSTSFTSNCLFPNWHRGNIYSPISISSSLCKPLCDFQALRHISYGFSLPRKHGKYVAVKSSIGTNRSLKRRLDASFASRMTTLRLLRPKWEAFSSLICSMNRVSWSQGSALIGLLLGSFICFSTFDPTRAEAFQEKEVKEVPHDSSSDLLSHGKKVYTEYSVTGIPGDGRCLFRSVAHGACLRSGKLAPSETLQRELADELRARVADEFIKRREETEWFIEGDFENYVSQIRKPHVWGGEPELLMLSHVLEMPITVYMRDENSKGLISIAEYGQEYSKEDPIRVLYHGFGHYDALLFPGNKGYSRSRL